MKESYLGNDLTEGIDKYEVGVAGADISLALSELSPNPAEASKLSVVPTVNEIKRTLGRCLVVG